MMSPEETKDADGTRVVMGKRALQVDHGHVVGCFSQTPAEGQKGRLVGVELVVVAVAGDGDRFDLLRKHRLDGARRAAAGLLEILGAVVQVGDVSDPHGYFLSSEGRANRPSDRRGSRSGGSVFLRALLDEI